MDLKTSLFFLLLTCYLASSTSTFALSTDTKQPIKIEADKAIIDDISGVATYEGNVVVTQGSIQINANKVTLNYSEKQTLEKVVAEGEPAHFKQTPEGGKSDIQAKAKRMEYFADVNVIQLSEGAELWQGKDTFTGQRIKYNTQNGVIEADKGDSKEGRVSVVIQPRSHTTEKDKR